MPPKHSPLAVAEAPDRTSWEDEWRQSLRSAQDLYEAGLITEGEISRYAPLLRKYQFLLPRYYAALIDKNDPQCPIRRQAIPSLEEGEPRSGFHRDPLRDLENQPNPRVTHRYPNRALLHLTPLCSMYCRFCFRKTLLNDLKGELFGGELSGALAYFREHSEVEEIIFSGGDPFLANPALLDQALEGISGVPHVKRIRFHTRVPVTLPSRVTPHFARTLAQTNRPWSVVTHFNHPKEVTPASLSACRTLRDAGAVLLNQSVLLRGINDSATTLAELSAALFEGGVIPYYLHHPDRSEGTHHFDLPRIEGVEIWRTLRRKLPGYLVPRYVVDIVGHPHKTDVESTLSSCTSQIDLNRIGV